MKPSIYLETSVFGYLAMRPSRDLRTAANQESTREWWRDHRHQFDLFVSRFVVEECADGDPVAAAERSVFLEGVPLLEIGSKTALLAAALVRRVPLPAIRRLWTHFIFPQRPSTV